MKTKKKASKIPDWTELISWLTIALTSIGLGKEGLNFKPKIVDGIGTLLLPESLMITWDEPVEQWELGSIAILRGVWRTKNGDGWPDEEEHMLLKSFDHRKFHFVAQYAAEEISKRRISGALDGEMQDRMEKEADNCEDELNRSSFKMVGPIRQEKGAGKR